MLVITSKCSPSFIKYTLSLFSSSNVFEGCVWMMLKKCWLSKTLTSQPRCSANLFRSSSVLPCSHTGSSAFVCSSSAYVFWSFLALLNPSLSCVSDYLRFSMLDIAVTKARAIQIASVLLMVIIDSLFFKFGPYDAVLFLLRPWPRGTLIVVTSNSTSSRRTFLYSIALSNLITWSHVNSLLETFNSLFILLFLKMAQLITPFWSYHHQQVCSWSHLCSAQLVKL